MKTPLVVMTSIALLTIVPAWADDHNNEPAADSTKAEHWKERKEMHKRHRAERKAMKDARRMEKIDTNDDGKLDLNEYLANAQERFTAMDLDSDGFVTSDEASQWRSDMKSKFKEARKARHGDKRKAPYED